MGGHGPPPVPDWRTYKIDHIPELVRVQRMLAQEGLKDPWLRNEAWRYPPHPYGRWSIFHGIMFRGFKYGFAAFVLTVVGDKIYTALKKDPYVNISHH